MLCAGIAEYINQLWRKVQSNSIIVGEMVAPKFSTILEFSTIMDFCVVQGNELSRANTIFYFGVCGPILIFLAISYLYTNFGP